MNNLTGGVYKYRTSVTVEQQIIVCKIAGVDISLRKMFCSCEERKPYQIATIETKQYIRGFHTDLPNRHSTS